MSANRKCDAGTTTRAVVYTRFSPRRSADECESCAWQRAECEEYAHKKGYTIVQAFDDPDVSGADAFRPTLWEAIKALRKGDALIVWKWDRLARDLVLALQIERAVEQKGATVVATTGDVPGNDPQAQFTRHILMAVAELERKMIKERTSAAMRSLQRAGRRMSALTPYGWRVDQNDQKRLVEDADEQATRSIILELAQKGFGSCRIKREIERRGLMARGGKPWERRTIINIVRRG